VSIFVFWIVKSSKEVGSVSQFLRKSWRRKNGSKEIHGFITAQEGKSNQGPDLLMEETRALIHMFTLKMEGKN